MWLAAPAGATSPVVPDADARHLKRFRRSPAGAGLLRFDPPSRFTQTTLDYFPLHERPPGARPAFRRVSADIVVAPSTPLEKHGHACLPGGPPLLAKMQLFRNSFHR
jgi:hypothetical protein